MIADASPQADHHASVVHGILPATHAWPLHDALATRAIESAASGRLPPNALMQRAGLASARLALAIAPHARRIWVAAGPGNNGGDALVAATHLHAVGKQVRVTLVGDPARLPADAAIALQQARAAGVSIAPAGGADDGAADCELAVDGLLGLGASRAPEGALAQAIERLNALAAPVLAIDLPSGLHADTGRLLGDRAVRATHTLSLLTLKPGLFTAQGRDHAGRVWLDDLGASLTDASPSAMLSGPDRAARAFVSRAHAQHKGSFGDVIVIGGAPGFEGAARLAACAALAAGAGRVYLAMLDDSGAAAAGPARPELMQRRLADMLQPAALQGATVVCGCGGGAAVRAVLPAVIHHAQRLVLDADALNAIAGEPSLASALRSRASRALQTVLTPHPLEAARLLGKSTAEVQADRLPAASTLADKTGACVVLKGSGSVIAAPAATPVINSTGNARLASAGTGDVLAGWIGGLWSQHSATDAMLAAEASVWLHGRAAENGDPRLPLRAGELIEAMQRALPPA